MNSINRILVPTDLSNRNLNAYNHARQIASRNGAKIDFIHIIPTLGYFNESLQQLSMPLDMENDIYPQAQERVSGQIKQLMHDHLDPENKGEGVVRVAPKPSKAIAEYAEQGDYDLIVMETTGRSGLKHFIFGSRAEKVVRHSDRPVVTVKSYLVSAA